MSPQQENSKDLTESLLLSSYNRRGKFRTLKYYSVPDRLMLKKKIAQDNISGLEVPGVFKPEPSPSSWPGPSGVFSTNISGNPQRKSYREPPPPPPSYQKSGRSPQPGWIPNFRKTILAEHVNNNQDILHKLEQQVDRALKIVESNSVKYKEAEDKVIDLKLNLAQALFFIGNEKTLRKAEEILDEAKVWADACKEVKVSVLTDLKIAQVMSVLNHKNKKEAERITRKAFKKTYKKVLEFHPETADVLLSNISETLARVATPTCINQIEKVVNLIKDKEYQQRTIINVASELSGQSIYQKLQDVDFQTLKYSDQIGNRVVVEKGNQKESNKWSLQMAEKIGRAWKSKVSEMPSSVYRPYAIGAISLLFEQEDDVDDLVEQALHYCDEDLSDDRQRLNFTEFLGNRAVNLKKSIIVRKLLAAQNVFLEKLKVAGTTLFQINATRFLDQYTKFSSVLDRIDEAVVEQQPDLAGPVIVSLFQSEKFEQAQKALVPLSFVSRTQALIESSILLLSNDSSTNDSKNTNAVKLFEQAINETSKIEDAEKFILTLGLITTVSLYGPSMALPTQEVSPTSQGINATSNSRGEDLFTSGIILVANHTVKIIPIAPPNISNVSTPNDQHIPASITTGIGLQFETPRLWRESSGAVDHKSESSGLLNLAPFTIEDRYRNKKSNDQSLGQSSSVGLPLEPNTWERKEIGVEGKTFQVGNSDAIQPNVHSTDDPSQFVANIDYDKRKLIQHPDQRRPLERKAVEWPAQSEFTQSQGQTEQTNLLKSQSDYRIDIPQVDIGKRFIESTTTSPDILDIGNYQIPKGQFDQPKADVHQDQLNLSMGPYSPSRIYNRGPDETKWDLTHGQRFRDWHDRSAPSKVDLERAAEVNSAKFFPIIPASNLFIGQNQKEASILPELRQDFLKNNNQLFIEATGNKVMPESTVSIGDPKLISRYLLDDPLATTKYMAFSPAMDIAIPQLTSRSNEQKALLQNWALGQVRNMMTR